MTMDRWKGNICVVVGAAGGIGSQLIKTLLKYDVIVVGLDIMEDKLLAMKEKTIDSSMDNFHIVRCDLRSEMSIVNSFEFIQKNFGPVSILINAAGTADTFLLLDVNEDLADKLFETNVTALVVCCRIAVNSMVANGIQGHIINVCSILGHKLETWSYEGIVYAASKEAVRVISEGLRRELLQKKSKIKVTNLSPGIVKTSMTEQIKSYAKIEADDVAEACITALKTGPNVLVSQLTVVPVRDKLCNNDISSE